MAAAAKIRALRALVRATEAGRGVAVSFRSMLPGLDTSGAFLEERSSLGKSEESEK